MRPIGKVRLFGGKGVLDKSKGDWNMEKSMYMMMIEKSKTYNRITKKVVEEHVANIRKLDDENKLEICGVFKGYPGVAGRYVYLKSRKP